MKAVQVGNRQIGGDGRLFVMAGPCVIEDPERVLRIGREMKAKTLRETCLPMPR